MPAPLYAIGDLHGQLDELQRALALVWADGGSDAEIIFLGDFVDRGPGSKDVIQTLIDGRAEGKNWHFVKGNHDRMFARFLASGRMDDPRIHSGLNWLSTRLGGSATLASYGIDVPENADMLEVHSHARRVVPQNHSVFLENTALWIERGNLLFVHAGIKPRVSLDAQTEDDLIWIRDPFLNYTKPHPWLVVHGHTALEHPAHFGNRIDLDGGAGFGRPIHPAVFEGDQCWLLKAKGRVELIA